MLNAKKQNAKTDTNSRKQKYKMLNARTKNSKKPKTYKENHNAWSNNTQAQRMIKQRARTHVNAKKQNAKTEANSRKQKYKMLNARTKKQQKTESI